MDLSESFIKTLDQEISFITKIFSDGVAKENEVTSVAAQDYLNIADHARTTSEYCEFGLSAAPREYEKFLTFLGNKKLKILDVGVGRGESSVFLANLGHSVFSVEPGLGFCRLLAFLKLKFKLELYPICCIGEELTQINENNFDLVIFNSSLHHCDDPLLALRQAYSILKPGGHILLSAETQLRPWASKKTGTLV